MSVTLRFSWMVLIDHQRSAMSWEAIGTNSKVTAHGVCRVGLNGNAFMSLVKGSTFPSLVTTESERVDGGYTNKWHS